MKHIKANQEKIDRYELGRKIENGLTGGRNSSPQNSGVIMIIATLSRPIFRNNGYCIKNCAYAETAKIRGKSNVLEAIDRGAIEFGYLFMKITEIDKNIHPVKKQLLGQNARALTWKWLKVSNKKEALNIIKHNEKMLQPF